MARYGFLMRLKNEEMISEYEALHHAVDADVLTAHSRSGIHNYSIYRSGLVLFGYFEADDPGGAIDRLSQEPVMHGWWAKTSRLMDADENNMPRIGVLPEIFHMA